MFYRNAIQRQVLSLMWAEMVN